MYTIRLLVLQVCGWKTIPNHHENMKTKAAERRGFHTSIFHPEHGEPLTSGHQQVKKEDQITKVFFNATTGWVMYRVGDVLVSSGALDRDYS